MNFGAAKHWATMTSQSKWGHQLKEFKRCSRPTDGPWCNFNGLDVSRKIEFYRRVKK